MARSDGLFYFITLFITSTATLSSYTLFYRFSQSSYVTVHTNISPESLAFTVQQHGSPQSTVLVNGKTCNVSCSTEITSEELSILTFDNNEDNSIEFYSTHNETVLFYRGCVQNMSYSQCRDRVTENYRLCVCEGLIAVCSQAESLRLDKNCSVPEQSLPEDILPLHKQALAMAKLSSNEENEEALALAELPLGGEEKKNGTNDDDDDELKEISEQEVDLHNVTEVLNRTLVHSENRTDLQGDDIQKITTILQKCANLSGIQPEDSQKVLLNIDCILSADASQIIASNSSQVLLGLIPLLVQNTNATSFDFIDGENIGFTAKSVSCSSEQSIGLLDTGREFKSISNNANNDNEQSIFISSANSCESSSGAKHMFVTIYRNHKLFNGKKKYNAYRPTAYSSKDTKTSISGSEEKDSAPSRCDEQVALVDKIPVMSGTVISQEQSTSLTAQNRTMMATLHFSLANVLRPLHGHLGISWWDTKLLEWSTADQCKITFEKGKLVASCSHLTDFALIVDGALNDPIVCNKSLYGLGYLVNSLSIMSLLFLTVMAASAYWPKIVGNHFLLQLRGYAPPKRDFVSLCHKVAMLLFYLVFTIFSDKSKSGRGCSAFAAIAYMLIMSSVLLTIFQALRLIKKLANFTGPCVKVLQPVSVAFISFLPPFVTSLLLATTTAFFERGDSFCWIRPDRIFYAIILPTTIMILNAIFCTAVMCKLLFKNRNFSKSMRKRERTRTLSKLGTVFFEQLSMGTPWALQYLTLYTPFTTVWHYLFTTVMGSQGTMLAMQYLYKRQKAVAFYRGSYHIDRVTKKKTTNAMESSCCTWLALRKMLLTIKANWDASKIFQRIGLHKKEETTDERDERFEETTDERDERFRRCPAALANSNVLNRYKEMEIFYCSSRVLRDEEDRRTTVSSSSNPDYYWFGSRTIASSSSGLGISWMESTEEDECQSKGSQIIGTTEEEFKQTTWSSSDSFYQSSSVSRSTQEEYLPDDDNMSS